MNTNNADAGDLQMDSDCYWAGRDYFLVTLLVWFFSTYLPAPAATAEEVTSAATRVSLEILDTTPPHGALRVIKLNDHATGTAHRDTSLGSKMLHDFAKSVGREIEWVDIFRSEEAFQKLIGGDGDLSISAMPIDRSNDPRLHASVPIALKRFRVIGREDKSIENPLGLNGISLAVKLSSPMWPYLDQLRAALTDLRLQVLPNQMSREEMLRMVNEGIYDAALLETDIGAKPLADFPRLKYLFDLTGPEPVAWFVREDRTRLVDQLNSFIKRYHTAYNTPDSSVRSFGNIKKQGALRVITRFDGNNYFLQRGRPAGFELDLARRFAERHGLRLEVLVGRDDDQILRWLRRGAGDIVTTRINERHIRGEPAFSMSREYRHDASVLISAAWQPIHAKVDLRGKIIAGYQDSSNLVALEYFVDGESAVIAIDTRVSLALLLERIESGLVDAAVIDAHQLKTALAMGNDVIPGMSIPNPYRYRWTLRGNDRQMVAAVEEFIQFEYRKETYNILERRYVGGSKQVQTAFNDISPFDDLLQIYSERYDFDWRLIAAQMYQESHFDPDAVSHAGAVGLMQLMPATAEALGFENPDDPETGIHAGVKYLNHLRNRFDKHIPMDQRTWLALAAYNIGFDRVRRARNRARSSGLDPDKWFGNVEVAMRQMTRSYWESRAGCRCGQAIIYVSSIRSLYYAYRYLEHGAKRKATAG